MFLYRNEIGTLSIEKKGQNVAAARLTIDQMLFERRPNEKLGRIV
jgi:hypothetical protein